jgi:D-glycero-alpha-D-manno-heptose 1-phosphate guanylyltransferase
MIRQAIVLAGGLGTRLRALVPDSPKPMALVAGRPFLAYILDFLVQQKFTDCVISTGYKGDVIHTYFGRSFGPMQITYASEHHPLGTGGAIKRALEACRADTVFVFNGDTFFELDCDRLLLRQQQANRPLIVGRFVSDVSRYGRLDTRDELVVGISEKSAAGPGIVNAGCYLLPKDALVTYTQSLPFSFERDFLATTLPTHPFALHLATGLFIDIGTPEDYLAAQSIFRGLGAALVNCDATYRP